MPKNTVGPARTSYIYPGTYGTNQYPVNIKRINNNLCSSFKNALESDASIDSFKSDLKLAKRADQDWSTKLAESYFKELNRRVDRLGENFNSLTHDYDKLFVNEDDKFLFLNKLSSLIQNLVYKGGDKEKNPILVLENQNQLIQNYIEIAHKNLGSEGSGKERSLDSSGSSANDGIEINKISNEARKRINFLINFSKGHYDLGNIDIDEELEEIKSFLKDNENHLGAPPSPSSTNRKHQSPSYLDSTLSSTNRDPKSPLFPESPSFLKSPTAFSPSRSSEPSKIKSKKVDLENLLKELMKIYKKIKNSQSRAKSFAKSEENISFQLPEDSASEGELPAESKTLCVQSNKVFKFMKESSVLINLSSRLGSLAKPETPRAQSSEANKLFADPETPRDQSPSTSPSPKKLLLQKFQLQSPSSH